MISDCPRLLNERDAVAYLGERRPRTLAVWRCRRVGPPYVRVGRSTRIIHQPDFGSVGRRRGGVKGWRRHQMEQRRGRGANHPLTPMAAMGLGSGEDAELPSAIRVGPGAGGRGPAAGPTGEVVDRDGGRRRRSPTVGRGRRGGSRHGGYSDATSVRCEPAAVPTTLRRRGLHLSGVQSLGGPVGGEIATRHIEHQNGIRSASRPWPSHSGGGGSSDGPKSLSVPASACLEYRLREGVHLRVITSATTPCRNAPARA